MARSQFWCIGQKSSENKEKGDFPFLFFPLGRALGPGKHQDIMDTDGQGLAPGAAGSQVQELLIQPLQGQQS